MSVAALDLLTFIALSCGVHADALQSQVDDTRRAIMQMSSDEDTLVEMEATLRDLLRRQAKLHTLRNAIAHSRKQRHGGEADSHTHEGSQRTAGARRTPSTGSRRSTNMGIRHLTRSEASVAPSTPDRIQTDGVASSSASSARLHGMRAEDVVRLSARAVDDGDLARDSALGTATGVAAETTASDIESIDAETDAVKEALRQLEARSLKSKLLRLEAHKKATAAVNMRHILRDSVASFQFSPAVERLWGNESGSALRPASAGASPASNTASPSKAGTSRRAASTVDLSAVEGTHPVVTAENLTGIVRRACQRLIGRHVDALEALGTTNLGEESASEQVLDCLLYACALDPERDDENLLGSTEANPSPRHPITTVLDSDSVLALCPLVESSDTSPARAVEYDRVRFAKASGESPCLSSEPASSVLGQQEFAALPVDWPSTRSLADVPASSLLPPARHLLTARFSFADAEEMKQLDTLRMKVQREVVRAAVDLEAICDRICDVAPQSVGPRDVAVLRVRLDAAGGQRDDRLSSRWRTIVQESRT